MPFLAYNGAHGAITTLGRMQGGIEIWLKQLSGVVISEDGTTATIGGGTISKRVTDDLWAAGKQTVTGACECVSYMGPGLGGGHGWLQGRHGLIADQFQSMNVVLANGTLETIHPTSELWWAMNGAGHNFGIVTSVKAKIYDVEHRDWAIETLMFTGDKVEAVYQAANNHLLKNGTQPVDIINWSYWLNNPDLDKSRVSSNAPYVAFHILTDSRSPSSSSTLSKRVSRRWTDAIPSHLGTLALSPSNHLPVRIPISRLGPVLPWNLRRVGMLDSPIRVSRSIWRATISRHSDRHMTSLR